MKSVAAILENWKVLHLQGPDTLDFLNRLTTVALMRLETPAFSEGFLLKANGKVTSYFKLLLLSKTEAFLIAAPVSDSNYSAYDSFENLHFMEKLQIKELSDHVYLRVLTNEDTLNTPKETQLFNEASWNQNIWTKQKTFKNDFGILLTRTECDHLLKQLRTSSEKEVLDSYRILSGKAAAPNEVNLEVMPLETNMESAVHENKGCYPGQEVIERIRSMGQAPRKLLAFKTEVEISSGNKLEALDQTSKAVLGQMDITSFAKNPLNPKETIGLGLIKKSFLNSDFTLNGKKVSGITEEAMEKLSSHTFPGNLRELEGLVEKAILCAQDGVIRPQDIFLGQRMNISHQGAGAHSVDWENEAQWAPGRTLDQIERAVILKSLAFHNGNRTHTARELGISIRTLRNKLNEYRRAGISV